MNEILIVATAGAWLNVSAATFSSAVNSIGVWVSIGVAVIVSTVSYNLI